MYTSTFTFAKRDFDDEFHAIDNEIARIAKSTPGYLGEESWENTSAGLISTVYYWETMEAFEGLVRHPMHLAAKQRQAQWLNGYHVVIAKVISTYGDGGIEHPLAQMSTSAKGSTLATIDVYG
jgi:heme-degrading monooxygenase HmoA